MDAQLIQLAAGAAAVIGLTFVIGWLRRVRRERAYAAERRRELRQARGHQYMQQQELDRLASAILATSSTGTLIGFELVRQIEAVFTDGHISAPRAVQVLKAEAAMRGANAIVHLATQRVANGKFAAQGDAVFVRPAAQRPAND